MITLKARVSRWRKNWERVTATPGDQAQQESSPASVSSFSGSMILNIAAKGGALNISARSASISTGTPTENEVLQQVTVAYGPL